jgi:flagellar hook-associated protein 1 FlgK
MSLSTSLQIGRSALTAGQMAIQIAGNNVSNATTPGYSRQTLSLTPTQDTRFGGNFIGRGVNVQAIRRQVDDALQARLWSGLSAESAGTTDLRLLGGVENVMNALGGTNLSTQLNAFFNSWSTLADTPGAGGPRALVVQQGQQLASYVKNLRSQLVDQRLQVDRELGTSVLRADDLLNQIANLNTQIVTAENGQGVANGLRDQRDALITELSKFMDITAVQQANGNVDILVASQPVVLAGRSRGLQLKFENDNGTTVISVTTRDNQEKLAITTGTVGSLMRQRNELVTDTIQRVDNIAKNLIHEVNRIYSQGTNGQPVSGYAGLTPVGTSDLARSFNDPANVTFQALNFRPTSGKFNVTLTNNATGSSQTVSIPVDLDGINSTFAPGFGDDTSMNSLIASLGGVANLSASTGPDGGLVVTAASGFSVSFSDDTSGVLAVLGVNTYFTGKDASDVAVRSDLVASPATLNAARIENGTRADNGAALALSRLREKTITGLNGETFNAAWNSATQAVAVRVTSSKTNAEATKLVRENLDAQRSSISGVSMDEEAINLVNYQRQYQAGARFITVVDEMTQTLLQLI